MSKTPKLPKTVRAEVSQARYDAFMVCMVKNHLNRQQLMAILIDSIPLILELSLGLSLEDDPTPCLATTPAPRATEVVQLDRRIHINTRQEGRFKKLLLEVPGCQLDVDKSLGKRDLLYPSSRESAVLAFLANCPKGSRKERETRKPVRNTYTTKRMRALSACGVILADHSEMSIDDLYPLVRATGWDSPKDFSAKCTLRKILKEDPLFNFNRDTDIVSLAKVDPPPVEEEPTTNSQQVGVEVALGESPILEGGSPKRCEVVPSYFPGPEFWER